MNSQQTVPQADNSGLDHEFIDYIKNAKNNFINLINNQEWNTELRTGSEAFVIAYEQVVDKLMCVMGIEIKHDRPDNL